jgi:hypothetical protein
MKIHFSLLLIPLLMLLAGQAAASFWFQVIDITPVTMTQNSEANFTVSVKGMGSERAYVELVFKNKAEGLDISCPKMIKNVFPAGVTKYECTVRAGDVAPGNYSFVVDVAAKGSPTGKKTAFVNVVAANAGEVIEPETEATPSGPELQTYQGPAANEDHQTPAEEPQAEGTPAPGAMAAALALMLVLRRMKRCKGLLFPVGQL